MAITSIKTGSSFTNLVKYNDFLGPNSAYIPNSFESIASATGTGSSGTISFSSIPSTYSSLQIRCCILASASNEFVSLQFNSDTASNYTRHNIQGLGSSVVADGAAGQSNINLDGNYWGPQSTYPTVLIIDILDYASTTKFKTVRVFNGQDNNSNRGQVGLCSGLYRSTSALSSIAINISGGINFTTDSTFALYGIKG
jgi:hypothetical protein